RHGNVSRVLSHTTILVLCGREADRFIMLGTASGTDGQVLLNNVPRGSQIVRFDYLGYESRRDTLVFPLTQAGPAVVSIRSIRGISLPRSSAISTRPWTVSS